MVGNAAINTNEPAPLGAASFVENIQSLARKGLTDDQIGHMLGKHYKTIRYHRLRNGIGSGRSHQAALAKQRRGQTAHKRSYRMVYTAQDQAPKGKMKHGLNAYAPITCRGADCPYRETCKVPDSELSVREPCKIESVIVEHLFEDYCREFQINEGDVAGSTGIRHLIDVEIKLMRCNRLMAANPGLTYTIREDGRPRKILNPVARYDLLLMRDYNRIIDRLRGGAVASGR